MNKFIFNFILILKKVTTCKTNLLSIKFGKVNLFQGIKVAISISNFRINLSRPQMDLDSSLLIEEKIKSIIAEIANQPLEEDLPKDVDLLILGYLDSFGFVQLLMHLEKNFKIEIDEEIQLDPRLRNISGIAEIVANSQ